MIVAIIIVLVGCGPNGGLVQLRLQNGQRVPMRLPKLAMLITQHIACTLASCWSDVMMSHRDAVWDLVKICAHSPMHFQYISSEELPCASIRGYLFTVAVVHS